jgi:D-serine deaminase-like pyridoxal phosphate-dependent protein
VTERTPRLVLDERRLDANIARAQRRAEERGAALRPHFKTHKSPEILRRQLAAGAIGPTVATLREAQVAVDAGAVDVLLAYPPVGDWRLAEIAALLERARLIVACSEPEHVRALAGLGRRIEFYWEIDTGNQRIGTAPGEPTAAAVAAAIAGDGGPVFAGLMAFAGHAYATPGDAGRRAVAAAESAALAQTAAALRARGIESPVISSGTTPLAGLDVPGATELRWGNAVFFDGMQVALGAATLDDCALAVETTVVARPAPDRVILDAGAKALSPERIRDGGVFGLVRGHPDLHVERLYEEHAICRAGDGASELAVGDRVEVVPAHACTCANLHAAYAVRRRDGESWARWPVVARGWGGEATD